MDLSTDQAQRGLHRYVQLIAAALGADLDMGWCEWDTEATAYLPLPQQIRGTTGGPGPTAHQLALMWDELCGWSVGVNTDNDFLVLATYHEDVLPAPRVVAAFVFDVADGTAVASAPSDADLGCDTSHDSGCDQAQVRQRLTAYAPTSSDTPTFSLPPSRL
ncbi:DUF6292 family protein [Lentzea alba]|uniref:DUF6292 family protein n=1 Tax=Lentzea alba TaxID=2714351 RepID=UPI0039BFD78A